MAKRVQRTPSVRVRKTRTTTPAKTSKIRDTFRRYGMYMLKNLLIAAIMTYVVVSLCLYFDADFKSWFITVLATVLLTGMFTKQRKKR